ALLGALAFCVTFLLGQSAIAWARALGPPWTARYGTYLGVLLSVTGMIVAFSPLESVLHHAPRWSRAVAHAWLRQPSGLAGLYVMVLATSALAYFALLGAERVGFDRLEPQRRAPKAAKHTRDRAALEWQMLLRHGGRAAMIVVSIAAVALIVPMLRLFGREMPSGVLSFVAGAAVYMGGVQAIAQAGRAAHSDAMARSFLAVLPLSPHQVLEGKARALRKMLSPTLLLLAVLAGVALWHGDGSEAFRVVLAVASLYVMADGAISVAFLSAGVGVTAIGGGQPGSSFSAQLLMMPVLATIIVTTDWAAAIAFVAVCAVTWEARRAAKRSVRWLDDPSDDAERETSVWRALLAATAFFALQAITFQLLDLGDIPAGYRLAGAYAAGSALLALLTWRNGERFQRPRWGTNKLVCWPLAALGGGASALAALQLVKLFPPPSAAANSELQASMGTGESLAVLATMTIAAPLIEEYFFRGWLQQAIEADLPANKKRWAFVLSAVAFALAHIGSYGIPQLVLGLIAGALFMYGGGLLPGMLAHAVHNGVVALLGAS
ncbi:MAG TPA: CPBP family intramembrane glutamic endopeptidase, partial [Polyangiales bacterium]|nr:CPBP family intramembrane glutamic endopeptidase [Polyangiales bacterium]